MGCCGINHQVLLGVRSEMGVMPLLVRYGIPAAAGIAVVVGIWFHGHASGKDSVRSKWNADKAEYSANLAALQEAHRAKEAQLNANAQRIEDQLAQAQKGALTELDATLSSLRSDNLRLRQRFTGCRVPETSQASGGNDGAGEGGLSHADEEFLVRIVAEADRVANKLAACQGYVRGAYDDGK